MTDGGQSPSRLKHRRFPQTHALPEPRQCSHGCRSCCRRFGIADGAGIAIGSRCAVMSNAATTSAPRPIAARSAGLK
jgi:hypothetical protein